MAATNPNARLSLTARALYYIGPPSAILLVAWFSPTTGLIAPLTYIPTAVLLRQYHAACREDPARAAPLQKLVYTFFTMGTVGLAGVALLQAGILKAFSHLVFPSSTARTAFFDEFQRTSIADLTATELAQRTALAGSWQNCVFIPFFSFILAGGVEEVLKVLPILYARYCHKEEPRPNGDHRYLDYALAGALSFGVVENLGSIYAAAEVLNETGGRLAVSVAERIMLGGPGHALIAALTAFRATRRDSYGAKLSWWQVLAPAVLLHGAWDCVAFTASTLEGNVGWIHPTGFWNQTFLFGAIIGILGVSAGLVGRERRLLAELEQKAK